VAAENSDFEVTGTRKGEGESRSVILQKLETL